MTETVYAEEKLKRKRGGEGKETNVTDGTVTETEVIFIHVRNETVILMRAKLSSLFLSISPLEADASEILYTKMSVWREKVRETGETLKIQKYRWGLGCGRCGTIQSALLRVKVRGMKLRWSQHTK